MKLNQLALSLLLSVSVSASTAVLAKSHHKNAEANAPVKTETTTDKKSDVSASKESTAFGTGDERGHHSKRMKKHQVAALPGPATPDNAAPAKPGRRGGLFGLLHTAPSVGGATQTETRTEANPSAVGHEGMVFVHGYTRKDGKTVEGYWRKKPHSK